MCDQNNPEFQEIAFNKEQKENGVKPLNDVSDLVFSVDDAVSKAGYGKFQIRLTILSGFAWLADASEVFILSVLGEFMACDWQIYKWQVATLTSIVFAGIMVGSPLLGMIADIYGRKKSLALSVTFIFIFGAISAASPSYTWMVIFRTLLGISLGGVAQSITLNSEYCPTHMRGKTTFYVCYFWAIGSIGVILLTWVIMDYLDNWRVLLAVVSLPSLIVILQLKWYPESARYFLVSNQYEKANKILQKMAAMNGKELPPGKLVLITEETKRGRIQDLLTIKYRRTTLLIWYIWFAAACGYFGIVLVSPGLIQEGSSSGTNQTNTEDMGAIMACGSFTAQNYKELLLTSFAELPGLVVYTFLIERVSRKRLLSVSFFISGVLIYLLVIQVQVVTLIFLFGARAFLGSILQLNYIVTTEAYPTTVRAVGMGTGVAFNRLGGLCVPYLAQVLVTQNPTAAMCVLGSIVFLAGIAAIFLPHETRGVKMNEVDAK